MRIFCRIHRNINEIRNPHDLHLFQGGKIAENGGFRASARDNGGGVESAFCNRAHLQGNGCRICRV